MGLRHFLAHDWLQDDVSCCTLIMPSLPTWAVLCTHHPALPQGVNPKFAGLRLQGLSQPWAGLVGSEPHRSAVLGTEALSTRQHLLLLSASAWWFMEWIYVTHSPLPRQSTRSSSSWPHTLENRNVDSDFKHLLYIKLPSLWRITAKSNTVQIVSCKLTDCQNPHFN